MELLWIDMYIWISMLSDFCTILWYDPFGFLIGRQRQSLVWDSGVEAMIFWFVLDKVFFENF